MYLDLSEDEKEFYEHFRRFCQERIAPAAAQHDREGALPRERWRELGAAGYNGLMIDPRFGGQGASFTHSTLAQIALGEACASTFLSVGASAGLFGGPLDEYGNEDQKRRYLPGIISGEKIGCLAVTEPGAGSDVSALSATAVGKENCYELSGQKTYITNAPLADVALVLARLRDRSGADRGLTHFIVELDAAGVSRGKAMDKLGFRASPTGELFFDQVQLPADSVLGGIGRGFRITMNAFNKERLALAAYCVGAMNACYEAARRYAKQRKAFGRPLQKHQLVGFMLADILTKRDAAYLLLMESAWLFDQYLHGEEKAETKSRSTTAAGAVALRPRRGLRRIQHNGVEIDLAARAAEVKLLASTYAREVANLALQIHGGAGYMEEYPVARIYRDVKLAEIGGGASEIQKQIIARAELRRI